jgi:adenylate cyclase
VFSLQDQVVEKVAAALQLRLIAGPRMAEVPGGTTMPAAYELYLHAYGLDFAKFPKQVASLLRQAVAIDPNYGQAWAELAWVYWLNLGTSPKTFGIPYEQAVAEIKKLLVEAEKHPSSDYYQLMADIQIFQRRTDEAIVSAERAIALNPSDHYGYEEMSSALVFNGRAADARAYLDGALRVDPQWQQDRYQLAGLIAFSLDQFDEAIASLAKADPEDLGRAFLLAAAHGHLGQTQEAESAKLEIERPMRERDQPPSALRAVGIFPFKQKADMERLLRGLRAAKVPDLPFDYPFGLQDRLKADQLQQLVFGHELDVHRPTSGEPYSRTTAADGTAKVSIGSSFLANGPSRIDLDFMCTLFDTDVDATCAAVFRNPEGTLEGLNEFVWMSPGDHVEFSQTK